MSGYPHAQPIDTQPGMQQPGMQQPGMPQPGMQQPGMQPGPPPIGMQPMPGVPPQAGPGGWAQPPAAPVGCPPGLEYLAMIDQLLIKQKVEILETFTGCETNNKYEIRNSLGQRVYTAKEDTCCCTRICCGSSRPFDIKIADNTGREVIHLSRPLRCSTCWCPCCLQKVTVESPPGSVVGYVAQAWSLCKPNFMIQDVNENTLLRIKGPICQWNICGDVEFEVTSADESTQVGRVTKQWSGLAKEMFTDADNFGITFPLDLDVKVKAVMLGAVFLIDFMYFEHDKGDVKDEASHL